MNYNNLTIQAVAYEIMLERKRHIFNVQWGGGIQYTDEQWDWLHAELYLYFERDISPTEWIKSYLWPGCVLCLSRTH